MAAGTSPPGRNEAGPDGPGLSLCVKNGSFDAALE